jgi:hypothetical protein
MQIYLELGFGVDVDRQAVLALLAGHQEICQRFVGLRVIRGKEIIGLGKIRD